jgi:RNA polymerase sigma-70 factor, ECF subfamily
MDVKTENLSDSELVGMLRKTGKASELAFTELYKRYSSRVYAYCRRFLGNKDTAKDVFQETFINFLEHAKVDNEVNNVPAYLLKIARSQCINHVRDDKDTISYVDFLDVKYGYKDDFQTDREELLNLITVAIDLLPAELKDIFILREYEGLSYAEIAEITNLEISNLKIRLYRAKQRIRELLQPYLEEFSKY